MKIRQVIPFVCWTYILSFPLNQQLANPLQVLWMSSTRRRESTAYDGVLDENPPESICQFKSDTNTCTLIELKVIISDRASDGFLGVLGGGYFCGILCQSTNQQVVEREWWWWAKLWIWQKVGRIYNICLDSIVCSQFWSFFSGLHANRCQVFGSLNHN